jgi:SAM-dependent methyltransferase/uncharacterized protein YbaR (Trm112 family)
MLGAHRLVVAKLNGYSCPVPVFACPLCRGPLVSGPNLESELCACSTAYPYVDGVPVLVPQPHAVLHDLRRQVMRSWAVAATAKVLGDRSIALGGQAHDDVSAAIAGMTANIGLLEALVAGALDTTTRIGQPFRVAPVFEGNRRWSFESLLPYFVEDWASPRAPVRDLVIKDVQCHARRHRTALVVGSGAGAVASDMGCEFDQAFGVDASLPSVLLSKRVLAGESVDCHLKDADWRRFILRREPMGSSNVRLVVGDASALPFADESFDVVVTHYLLDIVEDPDTTVREVNRVLEPGGVWIEDGLPCRFRGTPSSLWTRSGDAWPTRLRAYGFEPLEVQRRSNPHLDTLEWSPWATRTVHAVMHSVARKVGTLPDPPAVHALTHYFRGEPSSLFAMVPSLEPAQEVWWMRRHGLEECVGGKVAIGSNEYLAGDEETFELLRTFLIALLSTRTVEGVLDVLRHETSIEERDAILAIEALRRAGHLVLV